MASRREQKDQARRQREQQEAAAKASAAGRRRLIGYAAGAAIALVAVIAAIALLGGGDDDNSASAGVLPDGGSVPAFEEADSVKEAADAAGCELESYLAKSRDHLTDISKKVKYASKPPTSGKHYQEWAEDGAYPEPPDVKMLVHALEHGRIIIWFKKDLPSEQRAALKAYYDEDQYQMLIVPDTTGMTYEVAATAWNRDPQPNGTGRLMGCPKYNDKIFSAIETFKDEHRSLGPEPIP